MNAASQKAAKMNDGNKGGRSQANVF